MTKLLYTILFAAIVFNCYTDAFSQNVKRDVSEKDKQAVLKELSLRLYDQTPIYSPFASDKKGITVGDATYFKVKDFLRKKDLESISVTEANALFYRAQGKLESIDDRYRFSLHNQKDSRSILVSVDSLKKFVDSLYNLGIESDHKTGVRIVFGTYDFSNATSDQDKSGRMTSFFVGTIDTLITNTYNSRFYWKSQKDLTLSAQTTHLIFLPRNHGDLCPNNCETYNTIYRKN